MLWVLFMEYRAQVSHTRELGGFSAGHVSAEISEMVATRRDGLEALGRVEGELLERLAGSPADRYLHQRLKDLLDARFADFYTFSLATAAGEPLSGDADGGISAQCRADLRHFAAVGLQRIYVHREPGTPHYDVMSKWAHAGREGILLVSFTTDAFSQWLSFNEAPGYRLLLARTDHPGRVEIGGAGRPGRGQAGKTLDADALARVDSLGARAAVQGTAWEVVALPEPGLLDADWRRTLLLMLGVAVMALLGVGIVIRAVRRDARRHAELELERRRGQEELEKRVLDRTLELRRERDFVNAVIGAAGNVIVVLDRQGGVVRFNRAAEEMTGYTFEELRGQPIWEPLIPPERRAEVRGVFDGLLHDSIVDSYETEWLMRDGSRRLLDWRISVLHDDEGRVSHVVAQGYDITERKATELQLRQDREQQAALEDLLKAVLRGGALKETLEHCLDMLLSVSWLSLLPQGGIFLADEGGEVLYLAVSHNLAPEIQALCARVPMGRCLCGRAAESCELQYAACVNAQHEIHYPGMADHGHYSVPLHMDDKVLGVLVLYLAPGLRRDPVGEAFIHAVADILAGFIGRRRDELALRESENLTRAVMDSLNSTIAVLDHQGKIIRVNKAWRIFARENSGSPLLGTGVGLDYLEAVRRAAAEDHDARQALDGLLGVLERGEALFTLEYPCHSPDRERWFLLQATPLDESAKGLVVSHTDITTRKRAEAAVRESEQVLERAQAMAHVGSWTVDMAARTFSGSEEAHRIFGMPLGPTPWDTVFATFHPEDHDWVVAAWEQALAGVPLDLEFRILVSGAVKWVHTKVEVDFDEAGHPFKASGMAQDITDAREAQLALEAHQARLEELVTARTGELIESEARTRMILDSTADGLFGLDMAGRFTFLNPAACAMLGFPAEVLVGRPAHETIHHSLADGTPLSREECVMLRGLEEGLQMRRDDEVFWRVDGTAFPVAYALQPMYKDGRIVGGVVSFVDITRRRAAEAAREAALAEAERLARVRSEFLANMSHEIRTPLNAVLGLAQVGLRESGKRKSHDTFVRILDSGQLLLGIINDILDFSKIEAGRLALEQGLISPGEVIDRVVALAGTRAYAKGLAFRVAEAADLPASCAGDILRLSQILVNLLANAVKFTQRGSVTLRAWREVDHLCFSVEDTGIGMDEEQLGRLFRPFEQADGSTTRRFGGTGLGLTISRRLTDMMGGELKVSSVPGHGSTFTLRVPLARVVDRQPATLAWRLALEGVEETEKEALLMDLGARGIVTRPAAEGTALILEAAAPGEEQPGGRGILRAVVVTPGHEGPGETAHEHLAVIERPVRVRHLLALMHSGAPALPSAEAGTQRLAGVAVLAAEDNEVNRLVLEQMLASEGAELTCLENGRMALDQLALAGPGVYDIVLTDVQMPVMDGYDTARGVHALVPDLPVIGITAHAMAEEKDRCLAAGMVEHLAKPLQLELLVAAILRHARRPPAGGRRGPPASVPPAAPAGAAEAAPESAPDASRGDEIIDWVKLEARFNGKRDFVNKLTRTALTSQADAPAKLRAAAAAGEYEALAFLAHSLKGLGGNLMAESLHALATRAEAAAKARAAEAVTLAEQLARAVEGLLAALARRLGEEGRHG